MDEFSMLIPSRGLLRRLGGWLYSRLQLKVYRTLGATCRNVRHGCEILEVSAESTSVDVECADYCSFIIIIAYSRVMDIIVTGVIVVVCTSFMTNIYTFFDLLFLYDWNHLLILLVFSCFIIL